MHERIGPALCCVSITFIIVDIILQCKNRLRKLPDILRLVLLPHMLLYYILIALKPIDLHMLTYYASLCVVVGLARQFFYLSIMSWIAALSYSTCTPFLSLEALLTEENRDPQGFYDPRFKWYLLFSSGVPLLISSMTILIVNRIQNDSASSIIIMDGSIRYVM